MARVTVVVNDASEASETFLHTMCGLLVAEGHVVTVHEQTPGRAVVADERRSWDDGIALSVALPASNDRRFVPSLGRLVADRPGAVRDAARRAARRFGRGTRAARAAALAAPLLATGPDVVHVGFSSIAVALVDAIELLDPGTKLVVSCRGSGELVAPVLDAELRERLATVLERADAVHVVADCIGARVREIAPGVVEPTLIRPAIDLSRFEPDGSVQASGELDAGTAVGESGTFRMATVSRLHWIKAIDVQLSALATMRRRGTAASLTVVGDGPERAALEFRAHALGVAPWVRFAGAAAPHEVRALLSRHDVFLLSSLSEGTSNAVLEAMALGLPVVSTSVGGMPEVLTDEVDALLVAAGDAAGLAAAVERLAAAPELAARLGAAARRTVSDGFGLPRQRAELAALYRALSSEISQDREEARRAPR